MKRLGHSVTLPEDAVFPAGNMFWARVDAVSNVFHTGFTADDFQEESGQIDATLAHQLERLWVYAAMSNGFSYLKILNNYMPDAYTKSM